MIYNLLNIIDRQEHQAKVAFNLANSKLVEMKGKRAKRSVSQNSYLHVCISIYAIEFGYNLDEAKTSLKRECSFMRYEKKDQTFLKRTRDFDSKELTDFIDWIRTYAGVNGLYIPTSEEYLTNSFEIDKSINKHKEYL